MMVTIGNDPCDANPCLNGGTCTPINTQNYTCACSNDYSGPTCQTFTSKFNKSSIITVTRTFVVVIRISNLA